MGCFKDPPKKALIIRARSGLACTMARNSGSHAAAAIGVELGQEGLAEREVVPLARCGGVAFMAVEGGSYEKNPSRHQYDHNGG